MKRLFSKKRDKGTKSPKPRAKGRAQGTHKTKRILVCSDPHCGHLVGLTPPEFDAKPHAVDLPGLDPSKPSPTGPITAQALLKMNALEPGAATILRTRKLYDIRRFCWEWFVGQVKSLERIDAAIWNGDLIDGKGIKSGATELITADRSTQVDMAVGVLNTVGAPVNFLSYGTPYHTGHYEDWEREIANTARNVAKIGGSDWTDVNGVIIGYRHHCGRSSIPHGPYTPLAKAKLWELLWSQRDEYPNSDILIRSHVHYHCYCGGPGWVAMTTPALQGYGSKIARRTLGVVDFGFVVFDITGPGDFSWEARTIRLRSASDAIVVL